MPTFTLTVTTSQAQRIAAAFGRYWGLTNPDGTARVATAAEVKEYLIRQLRGVVGNQERALAEATVVVPAELIIS